MMRWLFMVGALVGCGEEARKYVSLDLDAGLAAQDAALDAAQGGSACTSSALSFLVGDTSARSFSAVADGNRVQLAFVAPSCGGETSYGQGKGVRYVSFASDGSADAPIELDEDVCLPLREPTWVGPWLYFGSARDGVFDLYRASLDAPHAPMRLTRTPEREVALSGALLGSASSPALAFVVQGVEATSVQLWLHDTITVGAGDHPVLVRREDAPHQGEALLGWRGPRGLQVCALDAQAQPGVVHSLSEQGSELAFAINRRVSACVYSETDTSGHAALRYRTLADAALGEPRELTSSTQDVRQPAVASYRNGFAVAYRNREPDGSQTVRALSFDEQGNVAASTTLADSSGDGTSLQLLSARDGRLIVLWDEPAPARDAALPDFNRVLRVSIVSCL